MFHVITIGSNTVDVFADTESQVVKFKTTRGEEAFIAYPSGTKILITNLDFFIGGGGTNTATAFARLGFKTGYVGRFGRDENSKLVEEWLKKEKITFLGGKGKHTGYSIVLDSIENDRTILTYKGCNDNMTTKDVDWKRLNAKWFYFSSMMNTSFETAKKILFAAKQQGAKIAFNPSSYQASKGAKYLEDFIKNVDVLVLNKEEAQYLAGPLTIDSLLKKLYSLGPRIVVITRGRSGVYAYDGTWFYHANTARVKVKETTGAGDAFASTFVAGLIMKKPIPQAIKMGMLNAESVIQYKGAKNVLLKRRILLELAARDRRKVFKHKI